MKCKVPVFETLILSSKQQLIGVLVEQFSPLEISTETVTECLLNHYTSSSDHPVISHVNNVDLYCITMAKKCLRMKEDHVKNCTLVLRSWQAVQGVNC